MRQISYLNDFDKYEVYILNKFQINPNNIIIFYKKQISYIFWFKFPLRTKSYNNYFNKDLYLERNVIT